MNRCWPRLATYCVILSLSAVNASVARAQIFDRMTNPKIQLVITHPPEVVLKGVSRIAVLEFTGNRVCAPQLTVLLGQVLQNSQKFELIDRTNINAILNEQGFQQSGAVSSQTAARISQIVGPAAFYTGRVVNCSNERFPTVAGTTTKDNKGNTHTTYSRKLKGHVTASVSIVDLTTSRIQSSQLIDIVDSLVNTKENGEPEAPSMDVLNSRLYGWAVDRMTRLVLPWSETVGVVVYDDRECGLRGIAGMIKKGDLNNAVTDLRTNIANNCNAPADRKLLAKANHNLGIALAYSGHPEDGLAALQVSQSLNKSGITNEAIRDVSEVIHQNQLQRQKDAMAQELGMPAKGSAPEVAAMTNKDVIDMVKAKLSDAIILTKIRSAPCKYDSSTAALIALSQAGVSEQVILAVTDAAGTRCR
ncbi:MAG: CsgG/HfaB family protein [Gemmatimonadaceae bacterium]